VRRSGTVFLLLCSLVLSACASRAPVAEVAYFATPVVPDPPPATTTTTAAPPPTTTTAASVTPRVAATPRQKPAVTTAPEPTDLRGLLDAFWAKTSASSCVMVSLGGRVLYERAPDLPLVPASTLKLATAAGVLNRLKPGDRLRTSVASASTPVEGRLAGDLWLVGGGDPVLGTAAWAAHFSRQPQLYTPLEVLADRVVAAGVREVTGRVTGDDSRYDRVRYVPTWPHSYIRESEIGPLSALSVNDGFRVWTGSLVPFADPAAGAAEVFTELLRARGVVVRGEAGSGEAPEKTVKVATIDSPTIAELVAQMVRESDNGTAELLIKELGLRVTGRGSSAAGAAVVHDTLTRLGLPTSTLRVMDGSGLDRASALTCRLLVSLLDSERAGGIIDRALPVAAQTGTLWKRFLATPVAGRLRAKTGSINGVAALAGRVTGPAGEELTFAFVQNGKPWPAAKALQEELGHILTLAPSA
jgi:D-alanyl-D-alanine carboxypeptidase/D-alanyl-D-alanine-endopeptidase (penicillin-binding protein 4)